MKDFSMEELGSVGGVGEVSEMGPFGAAAVISSTVAALNKKKPQAATPKPSVSSKAPSKPSVTDGYVGDGDPFLPIEEGESMSDDPDFRERVKASLPKLKARIDMANNLASAARTAKLRKSGAYKESDALRPKLPMVNIKMRADIASRRAKDITPAPYDDNDMTTASRRPTPVAGAPIMLKRPKPKPKM
jgi:hypothetical protein